MPFLCQKMYSWVLVYIPNRLYSCTSLIRQNCIRKYLRNTFLSRSFFVSALHLKRVWCWLWSEYFWVVALVQYIWKQYTFFSILTHFIITYHISLVNVQTNYCNDNQLILDVKQLNKILKLHYIYTLKALWDDQGKIKMH